VTDRTPFCRLANGQRHISRVYNRGRPDEIMALDAIGIEVPEGEALVLRGASGSGKSTLLGVIGCMVRPSAGRVRVFGREIAGLPEDHLTLLRRETFGFVFQQFNLIRSLSALENLLIPPPAAARRRHALAGHPCWNASVSRSAPGSPSSASRAGSSSGWRSHGRS
jgi:ABC-type lipoprotein export system ATPase subunit